MKLYFPRIFTIFRNFFFAHHSLHIIFLKQIYMQDLKNDLNRVNLESIKPNQTQESYNTIISKTASIMPQVLIENSIDNNLVHQNEKKNAIAKLLI